MGKTSWTFSIYLVAEGLDADTLSKLYSIYLPDFLLFGYDITPLEDMIRHGTYKLNGNSETGAHVVRHLIISREGLFSFMWGNMF